MIQPKNVAPFLLAAVLLPSPARGDPAALARDVGALAHDAATTVPAALLERLRGGRSTGVSYRTKTGRATVRDLGSALVFEAGMAIDADGAGDAWRSDPHGQPRTSLAYPDGRYVDPTKTPYFVLPGGFTSRHRGVRVGDLGAIIYEGRVVYAIFADVGPPCKVGEASIAAAKALGIDASPTRGGVPSGVTYVVFPGSGNRRAIPPEEIARRGAALLAQLRSPTRGIANALGGGD